MIFGQNLWTTKQAHQIFSSEVITLKPYHLDWLSLQYDFSTISKRLLRLTIGCSQRDRIKYFIFFKPQAHVWNLRWLGLFYCYILFPVRKIRYFYTDFGKKFHDESGNHNTEISYYVKARIYSSPVRSKRHPINSNRD